MRLLYLQQSRAGRQSRRTPAASHMEPPLGEQVMQPLATPVIGSMIHILIVTPVIFL